MHPVVFGRAWFDRYQGVLLSLLRAPIIGGELRDALAIRRHDVGYDRCIVRILPHGYIVDNMDGSWTFDVRTHAKYAKRLRAAFAPIWRAAHAWDRFVANPIVPALNLGFDTLTAYPDPEVAITACDGYVARSGVDETWATIRSGAGNDASLGDAFAAGFQFIASTTVNQFSRLRRGIYNFDCLALPAGPTISDVTLSLFTQDRGDPGTLNPDADIYAATPAAHTTIANADYGQISTTSMTGAPLSFATIFSAAYHDFVFNATGIATVSSAVVAYGSRNANFDAANVAPTWTSNALTYWNSYHADQTGSADDPKLVVTYAPAGSRMLRPKALRPRIFAPGLAR